MKSWRHMNLFQYKAYLHARLPRVDCPSHGIHTAKVPWAREGSGFTLLFEAFAMSLIRFMPVASAARILDEWDTRIWRIAHPYVDKAVEKQDLSHVTAVGVDETARKRGHNYISAFVDLERKGAVFVTEGKGKDVLQAFKSFLEGHGGSPDQVSDFTIDMSPAFITGTVFVNIVVAQESCMHQVDISSSGISFAIVQPGSFSAFSSLPDLSGLRKTGPMDSHRRVLPLQRSGWADRAFS
ncbi:helix-turn-helix domain-containing protein [Aminirod propionatiphilus]|uniref:helix-turn-helix domain-containing protein n=1 Tax=Aminirod propionatiphilus TaxID=3415223 RepID=UPI003BFA6CBF